MKFKLDKNQVKKYEAWRKKIEKKNPQYYGCNGGGYSFIFIPTSIGDIVKVRRDEGEELDLTDFENW